MNIFVHENFRIYGSYAYAHMYDVRVVFKHDKNYCVLQNKMIQDRLVVGIRNILLFKQLQMDQN